MPAPLSIDLRKRVIEAINDGMSKTEAASVFKVARKAIYNWLELQKETNSLEPKSGYQKGHSHKITDWDAFKKFVENNSHRTVKGMITEWKKLMNMDISESAMERALKKINYTSKKKSFDYVEANQEKREKFLKEIKDIDPTSIVYSDEMGIDDNEVPPRGWALRGKRCHARKNAERNARYNVIAALNGNQLFAPFIFEGYSNKSTYEIYVERVLVPALKPGQTLIIDNASFHKSKKIIELVESVGCKVIFLPPYSPDFNPIEHLWAAVKNKIRRLAETIDDFYEASIQALCLMCTAK